MLGDFMHHLATTKKISNIIVSLVEGRHLATNRPPNDIELAVDLLLLIKPPPIPSGRAASHTEQHGGIVSRDSMTISQMRGCKSAPTAIRVRTRTSLTTYYYLVNPQAEPERACT